MAPDLIDRLRHRLIRFLSCGDLIILNAELHSGRWRTRNAGPMLISKLFIRDWEAAYAISMGPALQGNASLQFMPGRFEITIRDCDIDMRPPQSSRPRRQNNDGE